MPKMVFFWKKL